MGDIMRDDLIVKDMDANKYNGLTRYQIDLKLKRRIQRIWKSVCHRSNSHPTIDERDLLQSVFANCLEHRDGDLDTGSLIDACWRVHRELAVPYLPHDIASKALLYWFRIVEEETDDETDGMSCRFRDKSEEMAKLVSEFIHPFDPTQKIRLQTQIVNQGLFKMVSDICTEHDTYNIHVIARMLGYHDRFALVGAIRGISPSRKEHRQ